MVMKIAVFVSIFFGTFIQADIFQKGKSNFGVSLGVGSSYNKTYTLVGLNGNYFVIDNLSVGLAYRGWFGATPMQNELSASTNYFIPVSEKFRPYIGIFARETFIENYENRESYGARGGLAIITKNTFISVGYAYESYSGCAVAGECSTSHPELVFGFSF